MNDERDPSSPDLLDDWLAAARWPEPTMLSSERLRARWRELRRPRRRIGFAYAAAAVIVLTCALWLAPTPRSPRQATIAWDPLVQPAASAEPRLLGREMTALEKTLLDAQARRESRWKRGEVVSNPPPSQPEIAAIAVPLQPPLALCSYLERVADAKTRPQALAELDGMKSPPTEQLLGFLSNSRADLRVAAALALGRIDGPVLTRRLINMVAADRNRREAFIALAASRGEQAQAFVRQAAKSQNLSGLARSTMVMNELQ